MERSEVSLHEVQVYRALKSHPDQWLTNKEILGLAPGVKARTVRAHTKRLVALGIVDQAEVFPAHRYRWAIMADKRNPAYALRLKQAEIVFGLG